MTGWSPIENYFPHNENYVNMNVNNVKNKKDRIKIGVLRNSERTAHLTQTLSEKLSKKWIAAVKLQMF